jgi:hypothetical protein
VVLVDAGRVGAAGTHDDLLATSERYREVLAALREEEADAELEAEVTVEASRPDGVGRGVSS